MEIVNLEKADYKDFHLTGYFRDGERRVDLVIASQDSASREIEAMKVNFLTNAMRTGVQFEIEAGVKAKHRHLLFIKVHLPDHLMRHFGFMFNIRKFFKTGYTKHIKSAVKDERDLINLARQSYPGPLNYSTMERSNIAYRTLLLVPFGSPQNYLGVQKAVDSGVFLDVYPIHDGPHFFVRGQAIFQLNGRQALFYSWVGYSNMLNLQPANLIREYLGEKVGFLFAFYEHILLFLFIAGLPGVPMLYLNFHDLKPRHFDYDKDKDLLVASKCNDFVGCPVKKVSEYKRELEIKTWLNNPYIIYYLFFFSVASIIMCLRWRRKENYFNWLWEINEDEDKYSVRPDYTPHTKPEPSPTQIEEDEEDPKVIKKRKKEKLLKEKEDKKEKAKQEKEKKKKEQEQKKEEIELKKELQRQEKEKKKLEKQKKKPGSLKEKKKKEIKKKVKKVKKKRKKKTVKKKEKKEKKKKQKKKKHQERLKPNWRCKEFLIFFFFIIIVFLLYLPALLTFQYKFANRLRYLEEAIIKESWFTTKYKSVRFVFENIPREAAMTMNGMIVLILEMVWTKLAHWSTFVSNIKIESQNERNIVTKLFGGTFFVNFLYIFFIIYFKGIFYTTPFNLLRYKFPFHLGMMNCGLMGCIDEAFLVAFITYKTKKLFQEVIDTLDSLHLKRDVPGEAADDDEDVPCWEREYELMPFTDRDITNKFNEIFIQFGFASFFVWILPVAPLCIFLVSLWQIRYWARLILLHSRRPLITQPWGLGTWRRLLWIFPYAAALFNIWGYARHTMIFRRLFDNKYTKTTRGEGNFFSFHYGKIPETTDSGPGSFWQDKSLKPFENNFTTPLEAFLLERTNFGGPGGDMIFPARYIYYIKAKDFGAGVAKWYIHWRQAQTVLWFGVAVVSCGMLFHHWIEPTTIELREMSEVEKSCRNYQIRREMMPQNK